MSTIDRVKKFHKKFGIPKVDKTRNEILHGRLQLIWEEFLEVIEAGDHFINWDHEKSRPYLCWLGAGEMDDAHFLKELADLDYVNAGTAEVFKWDFEEACKRVHASNMSKLWPDGLVHYREDGKVLKPPTYTPPDLEDLV